MRIWEGRELKERENQFKREPIKIQRNLREIGDKWERTREDFESKRNHKKFQTFPHLPINQFKIKNAFQTFEKLIIWKFWNWGGLENFTAFGVFEKRKCHNMSSIELREDDMSVGDAGKFFYKFFLGFKI